MVAKRQRRLTTMTYFYNRYDQFIIHNSQCVIVEKKHL